ncbi:MAG: ABC transporter permease [Acidimicrobiales bacterium]
MPAPSPDAAGRPAKDSIFASSGDLATEVTRIADGDAHNLNSLRALDPDQVDGARAKKRLGLFFWCAAGFFLLVVLLALTAPLLPIRDPAKVVGRPRLAPDVKFWFGTDALGRDIFSRVIWGARASLAVGFLSILFGGIIGTTVGIAAGYLRGKTETVLMVAMDVLLSFPALLLALAIVNFTDSKTVITVSIALGIVAIAPTARLVRANALVYGQREFVTAARSLGASHVRILRREILPNLIPPLLSFSIIAIAVAMVAEGGLSFLGLSIDPAATPTWGNMIVSGKPALENGAPWISLIPSAVLFLTVLALNFSGDRIREYTDVKEG